MRILRPLIGPAMVCALAAAALLAQGLRKPTPEEQAVLEKFVGALVPLLDRFGDENWVKKSDFFYGLDHTGVTPHPSVPLDVNENWERSYEIREGSPLFTAKLLPLYQKAQALSQTPDALSQHVDELTKIGDEIKTMSSVTVHVQINRFGLQPEWAEVGTPSLKIAGAAIAHQVPAFGCGGGHIGTCYVLAFGNWSNAKIYAAQEGKAIDFRFVNATGTPHIENAVIYIRGADDRIQQLLSTLDWSRIAAALTP